ncbi:MAG: hypothetical protein KGH74_03655, partial [Candidatus Micrarchaeota archaeon]|nr:hypothetical protein [Candidatus Micrarchaeota archaeon]
IVDEDPLRAHDNLVKLRSKSPFKDYKAQWTLTYFAQISSFLPLRNRFLEDVLKERIWHRTEETPRIDKEQLRPREFMLLRELNDNSNINFTDIDEEYKLNKGTSRYTYQNLKNRGIIARPTISMSNLDIKYIGIIIVTNIYYKEIQENRYKYLFDIMEYGNIANKYSLSGNIGAPNGAIMLLPVMKEGYLDKVATNIEEELKGSIVKNLVVTDIVTGSLCYRRFDADYSRQYKLLLEFGKIKPKALAMYE